VAGHEWGGCTEPLADDYDLVMFDLDGVVYVGGEAVPHAAEAVTELAARGTTYAYVTNNASRPPGAVAEHLRRLGLPAETTDVVTSSQAAARMLGEHVGAGDVVFVIGGEGLFRALEERDLVGTQRLEDEPKAVVSGYHPDLRWSTVIDGAILVREGLPWVATNTDLTVPTPRGPGPGNGVLVGAVARYAGVDPMVAGKPEPPLIRETVARLGGRRPLMVGDRLDTDIEGARRAGCDSLLVMTGVTDLPTLVTAVPELRPTYLGADLRTLLQPQPRPQRHDAGAELGGWAARVEAGELQVEGQGSVDDWWRVVATAAWTHLDATGDAADTTALRPPEAPGG
jgi:HAD superfamily hydrolase (TIGR01450 family)